MQVCGTIYEARKIFIPQVYSNGSKYLKKMFMGSNAPKRFRTSRTSNDTYFGGNFRSISSAN